jgi:hypothetical protein
MSQSWAAAPTTNYVETVAIRRNISFKENMAIKLYNRHCKRLCRRVYDEWYRFSFRYILLRRHLLAGFLLRYQGKRFYAWRHIARLSVKFRVCLKKYWRQHRRLYFRWWKVWTQVRTGGGVQGRSRFGEGGCNLSCRSELITHQTHCSCCFPFLFVCIELTVHVHVHVHVHVLVYVCSGR